MVIWIRKEVDSSFQYCCCFQAEKEAKEAEENREEMGLGEGDEDLKVLIQVRL